MSSSDERYWRAARRIPAPPQAVVVCPVCRVGAGVDLVWEPGWAPQRHAGVWELDNRVPGYGMRLGCGCQFCTADSWAYIAGQLVSGDLAQGGWCTGCVLPVAAGWTTLAAACSGCRTPQVRVVCPWCGSSTGCTGLRSGAVEPLYGLVVECCQRPLRFPRAGSSGWDVDPGQEGPTAVARLRRVQYAGPWPVGGRVLGGPVYLPTVPGVAG